MSYVSMSDLREKTDLRIRWQMDDGSKEAGRPQYSEVDWSDIDELLWEFLDMCDPNPFDVNDDIILADIPKDFPARRFLDHLDDLIDGEIYSDFKLRGWCGVAVDYA